MIRSYAHDARAGKGRRVFRKNIGGALSTPSADTERGTQNRLITDMYPRRGKPPKEVVVIAPDAEDNIHFLRRTVRVLQKSPGDGLRTAKPLVHIAFVVSVVLQAQPKAVLMHDRTDDVLINEVGIRAFLIGIIGPHAEIRLLCIGCSR